MGRYKKTICAGVTNLKIQISEGDKPADKEWSYITKQLADYLETLIDKNADDVQKLKELSESMQYLSDNLETLLQITASKPRGRAIPSIALKSLNLAGNRYA